MRLSRFKVLCATLASLMLILACGGSAETPVVVEPSAPPTEVSVQHNTIPVNLPSGESGQAQDFDSSKVLSSGSLVGGDRYTFARFERPFNANTMDTYFSQIDIINTQVFQDETWIYASISLKELTDSSSATDKYAVEIDANLNGKGDWLIIGLKPTSTDWTVNGVQIFQDTNKDVGLDLPYLTDEKAIGTSDGFETNVFNQGQGNDPDSAWVRISPNDSNTVEFAIKLSAIENPAKYLINMWAGTNLIDPANFDINDKFTHEQAGAADAGLQVYYPIKAVAEIDNSCRLAVGFQPTGGEAGICETLIPQSSGSNPQGCQATISQQLACGIGVGPEWSCDWSDSSCSCQCEFVGAK